MMLRLHAKAGDVPQKSTHAMETRRDMETHSAEIWRHDAFYGDSFCRFTKCSSTSETLEMRDEDWEELCGLLNEYK